MVRTAERNRELVADLATECAMLSVAEMMSLGRLPPANEARLFGDKIAMGFVAHSARFRNREGALVDAGPVWGGLSNVLGRAHWHFTARCWICGFRLWSRYGLPTFSDRELKCCHSGCECFFNQPSIACSQRVFERQGLLRPTWRQFRLN